MQSKNKTTRAAHAQRGVALVIVMLILLAVTGLALFSARYATLSETTARNQLDMERARQAAESALRDAERDIRLIDGDPRPGAPCQRGIARPMEGAAINQFIASCSRGQCLAADNTYAATTWTTSSTNAEPWWPEANGGLWNNELSTKPRRGSSANCNSFTGGVPLGTFTGTVPIAGVSQQPEYLIELVRRGSGTKDFFRITARGFGSSPQTQVVLQSYFRPPDYE